MSLAEPGWAEALAGAVSAVIAIGGGIMAWRKSNSRDSVDAVKDRAEEGLVERLQARADAAEKRADGLFEELQRLGDKRIDDARTIERLTSDLGHLTTDNTSLRRNLRRMADRLPPELRQAWEQALETDFAPLGGPEEPRK